MKQCQPYKEQKLFKEHRSTQNKAILQGTYLYDYRQNKRIKLGKTGKNQLPVHKAFFLWDIYQYFPTINHPTVNGQQNILKKKFIHPLEARTWQECGVDTNESIHAQLPMLKSQSGKFEVKSYYKVLTQVDHPPFPWKSIWKVRVPTRIAFFTWIAALGKILTIDNLRKRKVLFLDWCCMCKSNGELVYHLLLHCPITRDLWDMVFSLFGVCWVMPRGLRIYQLAGQADVVKARQPLSGRSSPIVSYGPFGVREMLIHLLGWKLLYQL